jgi:uncharacterized integral membrane protein (TIGR00698 family)
MAFLSVSGSAHIAAFPRRLVLLLPGFTAVAVLVATSIALHSVPGLGSVSPMILAVLLGMGLHSVFGLSPIFHAGLAVACGPLMRVAIVALGLQLTFYDLAAVGWGRMALIAGLVGTTMVLTLRLGRLLGVEQNLTCLIASGTAICGASAIAAANGVVRARDDDVSYAMICITLWGTVAMLAYPLLGAGLALNSQAYGLWVGASVHEVAQVIGAAYQLGETAGEVGTITKLARVLTLAPVVFGLSLMLRGPQHEGKARRTAPLVPGFIIAFVLVVALNSVVEVPVSIQAPLTKLAGLAMTGSLAAFGLRSNLGQLRHRGLRPLLLSLLATLMLSSSAYVAMVVL